MKKVWLFNCILFAAFYIISIFKGDVDKLAIIITYMSMILYKLEDLSEEVEELNEATKEAKEERENIPLKKEI